MLNVASLIETSLLEAGAFVKFNHSSYTVNEMALQQAWAKCICIHICKYLNTFLKVFVFEYFCEKCKVFVSNTFHKYHIPEYFYEYFCIFHFV